jgi:hypothetical protein
MEGKWQISAYNFADKRTFPLDKMEITLTVDQDMHIGRPLGMQPLFRHDHGRPRGR